MGRELDVFVLEDNPDLQALYREWLEPEYAVETADEATAALDAISGHVDICMLNRSLSGPNGDSVLLDLRDRGYEFPVAMVTGLSPRWEDFGLPWQEYLIKPVDHTNILGTVRYLAQLRGKNDEVCEAFATARRKVLAEDVLPYREDPHGTYDGLVDRFDALDGVGEEAFSADEWTSICTEPTLKITTHE